MKVTIFEYFLNNVYVTPSGMFDNLQLMNTHLIMGDDRILFSVEYPYVGNEGLELFLKMHQLVLQIKKK